MTLKDALTERFAMARSRVWESPRARRNMKRGALGAAAFAVALTFEEMMAGCGVEGTGQQPGASATPTPIDAKPSAGPVPGSNEVKFTDYNTQLFLKAATDYKDMNEGDRALLHAKWNEALAQLQDITSLDNHTTSILVYQEDGQNHTGQYGLISKRDIQHPTQMGRVITYEGSDGKTSDLGIPQFVKTDKGRLADYTANNQFMIPGFYGEYVQIGNQYVFAQLFPNATKISKEEAQQLSHPDPKDPTKLGTVEVEGNDKVGYYRVDGYRVSLFQVDGKHSVRVMANQGFSRGGAGGDNYTASQFISGDGHSEGEMGNDRTGKLVVIIYGGDGSANTQLRKYAETGKDKPNFVLDGNTAITTSKDDKGQTVYQMNIPQSALDNLPYIEGAFTN